ncbi:hypothetical protein QMK17_21465 [Rhodococcus sp. G-MC3]|uniref:hypothetical protein n=1 Tax=Rhodococcus sp. G-MC3 TaxID=3046209 RepID=UPI0024BAC627|nr:hypothetical protein [Rhodococcus sp. G-MC3]MDJ0395891.1 hypothetical protein [Rhodococcus sp. G-MC3]
MAPNFRQLVHRPLLSREHPLDPETAASRISAYVYGNILLLTVLIPLTSPEEHSFQGVVIVVGTAVSTFVAHAFAESVGETVRTGTSLSRLARLSRLRDSVPVLSAAVAPAVLLAIGWAGLLDPSIGQIAAEVTVIARIASTNFVVGRLRGEKPTRETFLGSLVLSVVAIVVVAIKVLLTH